MIGLLLFSALPLYSQKSEVRFGPFITFTSKKAREISLLFYDNTRSEITLSVSNQFTNYLLKAEGNGDWKRFKIKADGGIGFHYRVLSSQWEWKGRSGWIQLPGKIGYSFAVAGQSQDQKDDYWNMVHLFNRIGRHQPAFLIHTGNIITDTLSLNRWATFYSKGANLLTRLPLLPVIGSLDFYSVQWRRLFDVSNSRQPFYSYSLPLAHIMVVNSAMYFERDSSQYRWLEEELKNTEEGQWKILVMHHNPWLGFNNGMGTATTFDALRSLLKQYRVDVVFSGSQPYFERSLADGIPVINSGGLGNSGYSGDTPNPYRKVLIAQKPHYVMVHVTTSRLTVTAYDGEDTRLDTLSLQR